MLSATLFRRVSEAGTAGAGCPPWPDVLLGVGAAGSPAGAVPVPPAAGAAESCAAIIGAETTGDTAREA